MVSIAVAVGRIEVGQTNIGATLNEVKQSVGGLTEKVTDNTTDIAALKTWRESVDLILATLKPTRVHWSAIVAMAAGGGGLLLALADRVYAP